MVLLGSRREVSVVLIMRYAWYACITGLWGLVLPFAVVVGAAILPISLPFHVGVLYLSHNGGTAGSYATYCGGVI